MDDQPATENQSATVDPSTNPAATEALEANYAGKRQVNFYWVLTAATMGIAAILRFVQTNSDLWLMAALCAIVFALLTIAATIQAVAITIGLSSAQQHHDASQRSST